MKETTYAAKPVTAKIPKAKQAKESNIGLEIARNVFAVFAGMFMMLFAQEIFGGSLTAGMLEFAITSLLIMNNDVNSSFFKFIKNISCIAIATAFCIMFYQNCQRIVYMNYYIIGSIAVGIISIIFIPSEEKKTNNLKRTLVRIFGCIFFFAIAILIYAFLYKVIGISHIISSIITTVVYALFAFASAYAGD